MRNSYRAPGLAWCFVPAYAAHVAEEWLGGFPEWFAVLAGSPMGREPFLSLNLIGLVVMSAGIAAGVRWASAGWCVIAVATVALLNSVAHLGASLLTATYSPGLVTGLALWLPLALVALSRAWRETEPGFFATGVLAGLAGHALVTLSAVAASR